MDEILIDEKKYVSSKRAAKLTGYAKDYIGQLCREGRVPARLVGRSWYVLESAIADHRFGDQKSEQEVQAETVKEPATTWESPRYEASVPEILPSVSRSVVEEVPAAAPSQLQDSWKAWFDRVGENEPVALETKEEIQEETREIEEQETPIPVRTVYDLPPEDLLPQHSARYIVTEPAHNEEYAQPVALHHKKTRKGTMMTVQVIGAMLAVFIAMTAVIGTGYFDKYIVSSGQIQMIAGVGVYNK